ncbi:UDP-N-acetylglucosamine 2-epimerase (non-hydrolyzing) [Candidatus Parcubacteria bacterium]|nr:UDP-N-acetylglucosamine 2-epimerase (non-hydrolyzing) [Candidatus Parcubacteria bacterium]
MAQIKIINVVGARPNFMKIAPLMKEYLRYPEISPILVHTGQHYDYQMSESFFKSLGIKNPDYNLEVGSGTHAQQFGKIIERLEPILLKEKPNLVLVVGDVNSTAACAITAKKMNIHVAHIESGLRSFDQEMPEEINRIITDHISDLLFVSEKSGIKNLKKEGISSKKTYFVGNVMIDTLINSLPQIEKSEILKKNNLENKRIVLTTIHRPSNVDSKEKLEKILEILNKIEKNSIIVFPMHPRTKKNIELFDLMEKFKSLKNLLILDPIEYLDLIKILKNSWLVITDSGGIQEEAAFLKIPTITIRKNTERPATITCGANIITGLNTKKIASQIKKISSKKYPKIKNIPLYDGKAAKRIVSIITKKYNA